MDSYSYGSDMAVAALGAGFYLVALIIALICSIIAIIAMWKIFSKAGEAGWKSLIPIYNSFVLSKIIFGSYWWGLGIFVGLIPVVGAILELFYAIMIAVRLAKVFGYGIGMILLNIFIPAVGVLWIAFANNSYDESEAKFF